MSFNFFSFCPDPKGSPKVIYKGQRKNHLHPFRAGAANDFLNETENKKINKHGKQHHNST